eukprot:jgi/Psemu1/305786/fgenesh1_kg.219_\
MAGFCVTNIETIIDSDGWHQTCPQIMNSHTWAFVIDMIFTALCFILPSERGLLVRAGLASTIVSHGLLHGVLGYGMKCGAGLPGAEKIFGFFGGFISFMILQLSSTVRPPKSIVIGIIAGFVTVKLSEGNRGVSSIFLITQLLASAAALFAPNGLATPAVGNTFVAPCAVSILELMFCCNDGQKGWFNKIGGHVWYDFFLHISVLSALKGSPDKE